MSGQSHGNCLKIFKNERKQHFGNRNIAIFQYLCTVVARLYNNKDVVLNSISHLTAREDTIVVRKTNESETYTVSDQEDVIIKTIIFTVPMVIIFIGIAVWIFRRRKV